MILLILGVALWTAAHVFKRVQPERRAAMGDRGRVIATAAILGSVALMILGYKMADVIPVWYPPAFFTHINNLLMLISVLLFALAGSKGVVGHRLRHPMLLGFKTWAVAHLLVNGDLASILLFGGLLGWAVFNMILINKSEVWERPEAGPVKEDLRRAIGGVVVFIIIVVIHGWVGPSPLPMGA